MDGFQVRQSRIHRNGLFALTSFPARRKIGELSGELIDWTEARQRAKGAACVAIVEFDDGFALDTSTDGNDFRYVNHSCAPNTYLRRFRHHVELYALRRIESGEELTCDYGETQHAGSLRCRCGASRCRGRL